MLTKKELKENWAQVASILEQIGNMGSLKTNTFIRPLTPFKLSEREGKLYLKCNSDPVIYKTSLENYRDNIQSAIEKVFGKPLEIEITETEIEEGPSAPPEEEARPNPGYIFESFVAGPNNNIALAACLAVADGYSKNYNPLFLYGGSGLGKTHLMHAIWQYVLQNKPRKKVLYVTSETFTAELITAIQTKTQNQFKDKYRKVDYLLFDDVQFIQGRESTEEELFNTFDALYNSGKQVIFSSDRAPKDLGDIPDRLLGRFQWGMLVDIQPPDYETRVAILKNKADLMGLDYDENLIGVIDEIAQAVRTNIRELEGALQMIVNSAALVNATMDSSFARRLLNSNYNTNTKEINPSLIKKTVASYYSLKVTDLEGPKRSKNIVVPRQIAMYLIREYTDYSYPRIGEIFGGRDHTTVLHSCEKIDMDYRVSEEMKNTIDYLKRQLSN